MLIRGKLAYSVKEALEVLPISKTTLYADQRAGLITMGTFRGRTVIDAAELERYYRDNFKPHDGEDPGVKQAA